MADRFISASRGDDSTGTGSASSPWKTIDKAIGASSSNWLDSSNPNNVYFESGYYRELVALSRTPTSSGRLNLIGDGTGAAFRAAGYSTPAVGPVDWVGWTNNTTPMTSAELLSASGKSYTYLRGLRMTSPEGTGNSCFNLTGTFSDWDFEDCQFIGGKLRSGIGAISGTAGAALNVNFKRCDFAIMAHSSTYYGVQVRMPLNTSEYDAKVLFQNCFFAGSAGAIQITQVSGGSGSAWATGINAQQCDFWWTNRGFHVASNIALTTTYKVYGCRFMFTMNGIVTTSGGSQVTENGNAFHCNVPLTTGVSAGANSLQDAMPAFNMAMERLFGGLPRPYFEPREGSAFLGAGNYGTPPSVDLFNRARPDGALSLSPSIGAFERHDTGTRDTANQPPGEPGALRLDGPKTHDIIVLVEPDSTELQFRFAWDGNHGDATKPQMELLPNPEIGVTGETITCTGSAGSGATLGMYGYEAFTPFTPTAAGPVVVRFKSRPSSANGVVCIAS